MKSFNLCQDRPFFHGRFGRDPNRRPPKPAGTSVVGVDGLAPGFTLQYVWVFGARAGLEGNFRACCECPGLRLRTCTSETKWGGPGFPSHSHTSLFALIKHQVYLRPLEVLLLQLNNPPSREAPDPLQYRSSSPLDLVLFEIVAYGSSAHVVNFRESDIMAEGRSPSRRRDLVQIGGFAMLRMCKEQQEQEQQQR